MLKYLAKCRGYVCLRVFFSILYCALMAGYSIVFKYYIDYCISLGSNLVDSNGFLVLSLLLLAYICLSVFLDFLSRYYRTMVRDSVMKDIRNDYFKKLLKLDISKFFAKDTGHYISRITRDLNAIVNDYIIQFLNLVNHGLRALFCIIAAVCINWQLALVFIFLSIAIIIYTSSYEKKFAKCQENQSKKASDFTISLKSFLGGFGDIKQNNGYKRFEELYGRQVEEITSACTSWWKLESKYSPTCALFVNLLSFVAISGSALFFSKSLLSIGGVVAVVYLSSMIFNPISELFEELTYMQSYRSLAEEVFNEIACENSCSRNTEVKSIASIRVEGLSVKFSNVFVLKNVCFEIEKGKKYLIVGKSGAGKTTLLKAVAGLITYNGRILYNGIDLKAINKDSLYRYLSYVPQTPFIFNDSIRGNIDLSGSFPDEKILGVVEKVGLSELVEKRGLEAQISEEVLEVSGGERQRICLARALLKDPQLLLLDEVTASLDKMMSEAIDSFIASLNRTLIYVCHKPSKVLLESFDSVIEIGGEGILSVGGVNDREWDT